MIPADGSQPAGLNAQRARTVKQIRLAMRVEQRRIKRVYVRACIRSACVVVMVVVPAQVHV